MYTEAQKQCLSRDLQCRLKEGSITYQEILIVLLTLENKLKISVEDISWILIEVIPDTKKILKLIKESKLNDRIIEEIVKDLP